MCDGSIDTTFMFLVDEKGKKVKRKSLKVKKDFVKDPVYSLKADKWNHHCPIDNCNMVLRPGEKRLKVEHFKRAHPEIYEFLFEREWFAKTVEIRYE